MYLDSNDYQTIWKLAHNWTGHDPTQTSSHELPQELRETIQRILTASRQQRITVRTRRFKLFMDDSFFEFIFDFGHHRKFNKCLHKDIFDKGYLESLYVKRPEVISWCEKDYLSVPPIWKIDTEKQVQAGSYDSSDDENTTWYNGLSDRRKKRVACLDMAKKLWQINANQTYEEIYNHPTMKQFGNPGEFSFDAFKKWARPFAPDYAKNGGRRSENK